ncbi:hypothetical protein ACFYYR_30435 [Streptomyces sp. NPDC001922]|uniref:hypothetical protein n=1 Tax=Streptomyces sp. NPDC001922 TaxID=3364624 RepID=UPI0036807782
MAPAVQGSAGGTGRTTPRGGDAAGWGHRRAHPLRSELLRGIGPLSGAVVAGTVAIAMAAKAPEWRTGWADTTGLLRTVSLLLCGPVVIAAGAWQGGREHRRRTGELRASFPRAPLRHVLTAYAPAALWPVAGYLPAAAGCLTVTWLHAPAGRPFGSLLAADAVALASLGALGFAAGRAVRWRLLPPLLALAAYLALAVPDYSLSSARLLSPAEQAYSLWQQPVWWFGPAMMLWTGGLAATALLLTARHRACALLPLTLAVTAAAMVVQTGDGVWRPDPATATAVCDSGVPDVCVTRAHRRLLPQVSAALAGAGEKLRGVPNAPRRFVERPGPPRPGELPLDLSSGSAPSRTFARDTLSQAVRPDCDAYWDDERFMTLSEGVLQWLAPGRTADTGVPPRRTTALRSRLSALPERERTAWLGRYFAAARTCRLDAVRAP